jgi:hypothetical protein
MEKRFKEVVLKPFELHGREWNKGDIYRTVSISQRDADFMNSRKADFGFEYIPEEKKPVERVEHPNVLTNEKIETPEVSVEIPKPKREFPKKKH